MVFVIHYDFGMLNVAEGRGKESAIANLGTLLYLKTVGGTGTRSKKKEKTK